MATFQELLDNFTQAYERQSRLAALVGDRDWLLDTELATIKFGDDLVFRVHLGHRVGNHKHVALGHGEHPRSVSPGSLDLCRKVRTARPFGWHRRVRHS